MAAAADRILAKIDAVLPERLRPKLESSHLLVPEMRISQEVGEILGEARSAINSRHRMFVDYRNEAGDATERIVWPLALLYWGRTWTLGAWCELRQDFRNFRLDRMESLKALSSEFEDLPGRRLSDYLAAVSRSGP